MDREKLIQVFYRATKKIFRAKYRLGLLPKEMVYKIEQNIDRSIGMMSEINNALQQGDEVARMRVRDEVRRYNQKHIHDNESLLFPLPLGSGLKWWH
jgi:hypothetical protein